MLEYKHMQKERTPIKKFNPVFFALPAIILLFVVVIIATLMTKNAELILLVAPSTATIKLDGKKVESGSIKIRDGSHKLEISGDDLETKTIDFYIAKKETKSLNVYATSDDNSFDYYLKHDEEIDQLALVADDHAKEFVLDYKRSKTILDILPVVVSEKDGSKTSTLTKGEDCERSFCLKITDDNADLRQKMERKISDLGYDVIDYEIQYERTNSLEGDGNED